MKTIEELQSKFDDEVTAHLNQAEDDRLETFLKFVQLDALESVAMLLTANADSTTRGFEAVHKLIVELKSK